MKHANFITNSIVLSLLGLGQVALATQTVLGTAQDFAILGASAITNTGPTTITGDIGLYSGSAITGMSGMTLTGSVHNNDAVALQGHNDLNTAYTALSNFGTATDISGTILGDGVGGTVSTLSSGIYSFNSSAQLNGTLTLDAAGLNGAYWIFQINSTLTTASASAINVINTGSNNGADIGLYWLVGSSATLGTTTAFEGNILALTSITLNTGATINNGRALALNGAVTLDSNTVSNICPYPNLGPGFSGGLEYDDYGNLKPLDDSSSVVVPVPGAALMASMAMGCLMPLKRKLFVAA